jgi:hypothetical protein
VGDEFTGRKMKCPKCRTRIRHHKDGKIELLTVGEVPPPAARSVPAAGAAAPPAASEPAKRGSTVEIAVVPEMVKKLVSQSESKQNTIVIAGVIGFFAIVLSGIGIFIGQMILTVAPLAVGLAAAFVWLMLRARKRQALALHELHSKDSKPAVKDEGKTEALPKA